MVGYLLDTNIVSETIKPKPNAAVMDFLESLPQRLTYLSEVSILEIEHGLSTLGPSQKRTTIQHWLETSLPEQFADRLLRVDRPVIARVLDLARLAYRKRISLAMADGLIAATALNHRLIIVSRNVRDFAFHEIPILNPFTGERFNGA